MTDHSVPPSRWVNLTYNDRGIFLATRSGNVMAALEPNGVQKFLQREVSNRELGLALIECLASSRVVPQEEWKVFFNRFDVEKRWRDYQWWKVKVTGVKTLRAMQRFMMSCACDIIEEELVIYPCDHNKLNEWIYPKNYIERAVVLPYPNAPSAIGAAMREAMNRCTGLGREEAQLPDPLPD